MKDSPPLQPDTFHELARVTGNQEVVLLDHWAALALTCKKFEIQFLQSLL